MKIGFFDSGLGGLSIYQQFMRHLLSHKFSSFIEDGIDKSISLHYIADSKYAPYGLQSVEFIQKRCLEICKFLLTKNVDIIVIACNTATAHAIDILRQHPLLQNVPIVGVEPAIKPACQITRNHKIGVLATQNTLQSARLAKLIETQKAQNSALEFFLAEGKNWVEMIEDEKMLHAITHDDSQHLIWQRIQPIITSLLAQNIDTLILGCTHYPFLQNIISQNIKKNIQQNIEIVNNSDAISQQIFRLLNFKFKLNLKISDEWIQNEFPRFYIQQFFYSNADLAHMARFVEKLVFAELPNVNISGISRISGWGNLVLNQFDPFSKDPQNIFFEPLPPLL